MRTIPGLTRLLAVALAIAVLGAAAGTGAIADSGQPAAVPDPPWAVVCNTHGPYYDHLEPVVFRVSGATSYQVFRALSYGGTKSYVGNATGTDPYAVVYYDYDVDTYQTYYYWAKACNASGCSTLSADYAACQLDTYPAPTNVQASDGTYSNKVRVTYNEVTGPSKYAIYRSTSLHEARSVALENGLRYHLAATLHGTRVAQLNTNRLSDALATVQEELSIWRDLALQRREAVALEGLALILDYLGRSADSLRAMEQALDISTGLGDAVRLAINQYNLAYSLLYHDDANAPRAAELAHQALETFRAHRLAGWVAVALIALAYAHWVAGQHDQALTLFQQAQVAAEQVGNLAYVPELLAYQGLASLGLDRREEALALTRTAVLAMAQGEVSQEVVPEIYYAHAAALVASGMEGQARLYLARAYQHLTDSASKLEDDTARQAFFQRNPTMRRLMNELYARDMALPPAAGVISRQLPSSHGERPVQVRWTVDAGPPDDALRQARGAVDLRRSRLNRLIREAQAQGASPTAQQLAEALGVSKRTVQRDLAALRESPLTSHSPLPNTPY